MRTIRLVASWLIIAGVCWAFTLNGWRWYWALPLSFLTVTVALALIEMAWSLLVKFADGPLWFQRPIYKNWKKQLTQNKALDKHPLVGYPFVAFVELNLDATFETGGMKAARQAVSDWLDSYPDRMKQALEKRFEEPEPNPNIIDWSPELGVPMFGHLDFRTDEQKKEARK